MTGERIIWPASGGAPVVLKDGKPFLAIGTPGGDSQDQQILLVLLNIIDFGLDVQAAIEAQRRLPEFQGRSHVWYAGAWLGYGFHEDGLMSALAVVQGLRERWAATLTDLRKSVAAVRQVQAADAASAAHFAAELSPAARRLMARSTASTPASSLIRRSPVEAPMNTFTPQQPSMRSISGSRASSASWWMSRGSPVSCAA